MSLASYTDLQNAIANYLGRPADTLVTTPAPDFVTLAESRIAYGGADPFRSEPLRIRANEVSRTLTIQATTSGGTVAGTANAITVVNSPVVTSLVVGTTIGIVATLANTGPATLTVDATATTAVVKRSAFNALSGGEIVIGGNYKFYFNGTAYVLMPTTADVPLPTNYLAFRTIYLDVNPRVPLTYVTPDQLNLWFQNQQTGEPDYYTIEGDAIRFGFNPDRAYTANILYYEKFGALATATSGTNWLMTNKPDVYLYASLLEAAIYFGIDDDIPKWHGLFVGGIDGLQAQDERDRHSGSRLQMRIQTMTP